MDLNLNIITQIRRRQKQPAYGQIARKNPRPLVELSTSYT